MEAKPFGNRALVGEPEHSGFPILNGGKQCLNSAVLQPAEIILEGIVATRAHDDGEAGIPDPEDVVQSDPDELVETLAHVGNSETKGCSLLDKGDELVEIRP